MAYYNLGHQLWPRDHILAPRKSDDPKATSASLSAFLATLIPAGIIAGVMFMAFVVLRRTQKRQYAPRTYLTTIRKE